VNLLFLSIHSDVGQGSSERAEGAAGHSREFVSACLVVVVVVVIISGTSTKYEQFTSSTDPTASSTRKLVSA